MRLINELDIAGGGAPLAYSQQHTDTSLRGYIDSKLASASFSEPTRAVDTTYQNTTTRLLLVTITISLSVSAADGGVVGFSKVYARCSSTSAVGDIVGRVELATSLNGLTVATNYVTESGTVSFVVPPLYHYKLETDTSGDGQTPTIKDWMECELH